MTRIEARLLFGAGSPVFLLCCLLVPQGLLDSSLYSDVHVYSLYGGHMAAGQMPYRDFFDEYPPLAQPVFLLGRIAGAANYALAFKAFMALCGISALGCGVGTLHSLRASRVPAAAAVAVIAVSPVLVGPIFLNAYDLWPAFLLSLALLLLVRGRADWAFAVLGAAVAAKIYPVAVLPVALLAVERRLRGLGVFLGVVVLAHLPFAALGPGGLRHSYVLQAKRGLELNSLGSSILLAAGHPRTANEPPGSLNVVGGAAHALAIVSTLFVLAAIAAATLAYLRGRPLLVAAAAAVAGTVAFDKVFSAQYVDWLVPLVPLAGVLPALGTVPVLVLTRLVFSHRSAIADDRDIAFLLLRNAFAVALFVTILWRGLSPSRGTDRS